jgi:hypothetical protein
MAMSDSILVIKVKQVKQVLWVCPYSKVPLVDSSGSHVRHSAVVSPVNTEALGPPPCHLCRHLHHSRPTTERPVEARKPKGLHLCGLA